MLGLVQR
jgi:hypothetical protein